MVERRLVSNMSGPHGPPLEEVNSTLSEHPGNDETLPT
jgi:hypothetical protein